MSTISNRFFITALEDGTTLHGNLSHDENSLSQAWTGVGCVPDWSQSANQPTIYLVLMSGNSYIDSSLIYNGAWYYNNQLISFTSNVSSSPAIVSGKFERTTYSFNTGSGSISVPALKIIDNLASSTNVDIDTISFSGGYSVGGGALVDFSVSTQVRITKITANSYMGVVMFYGGESNYTEKEQRLPIYGKLYGGASGDEVENYVVKYYINGTLFSTSDFTFSYITPLQVDGRIRNVLFLDERDIVDNAVIEIRFYESDQSSTLLASAFGTVDDLTDPEYLYIQYSVQEGESTSESTNATLRKDQSITYVMFVGDVATAEQNDSYNSYKVKLYDAFGDEVLDHIENIPDVVSGWRDITNEDINKGEITITYEQVSTYFAKSLTGIVKAEELTT